MSEMTSQQRLWVTMLVTLVAIGGVLYGYDIGVIAGAMHLINDYFKALGVPLTPFQQGRIHGAVLAGGLVGTLLASPVADRFGRRSVILFACVNFVIGIVLIILSSTFMTLLAARLVLGVAVGIIAVAVPLYVTELVDAERRGMYVGFFQLFLTLGILLAYVVDWQLDKGGHWRLMFAVVLVPTAILFIGMCFLPESPRWLWRQGKEKASRQVLKKTHAQTAVDQVVNEFKQSSIAERGRWSDFRSRSQLVMLGLAVMIAILNQWTGINTFLQYVPDLLRDSGVGTHLNSLTMSLPVPILNVVCTLFALTLVDRLGRRYLLLLGTAGVFWSEVFLSVVPFLSHSHVVQTWLMLAGFCLFIVFFAIGPGVVIWLVISELFPTRLRGKAMALCLFFNSLAGTLLADCFLLIQHALGHSGTYMLCASCSLLYFVLVYYFLPETKRRSLESIEGDAVAG